MFTAALIYILAVMSPGPNFLLVSRYSASDSVLSGVSATIGICLVGLMFSTSSVQGLAILLTKFPGLGRIMTVAGAIYLLYIAYQLARSALRSNTGGAADSVALRGGFVNALRTGVVTNVTNLKTIAFMVSIFAGFLATPRQPWEKVTVIAICSTLEFCWYTSVALIFGQGPIQRIYKQYTRQIDGGLAIFLVAFAANNILTVHY